MCSGAPRGESTSSTSAGTADEEDAAGSSIGGEVEVAGSGTRTGTSTAGEGAASNSSSSSSTKMLSVTCESPECRI